jgi:hydrogenase maturation protease
VPQTTLIIGVGNEYRGDDGVGPAVIRALAGTQPAEVGMIVQAGEALPLINAWMDAELVILIDAVAARGRPGKIHRIDARETSLPAHFLACSTHDFGVAAAIELARTVGLLPPHVILYGVEGQDFAPGAGLSSPVARAVRTVAARVIQEARRAWRQSSGSVQVDAS